MNKTIKKMKKRGFSNIQILQMKEHARRAVQNMEAESVEKAFLYMLGISVNVLAEVYWPKTAKKKIPKFIDDVLSLFKSVEQGVVTEEDMLNAIKEYAGVDIKEHWYAAKSKYEDRHS